MPKINADGTTAAFFQVNYDGNGPRIADESGDMAVRSANNATYKTMSGADPTAGQHFTTRDWIYGQVGVSLQAYDADLAAIAALTLTGIMARTGDGSYALRTLVEPSAGISISSPAGLTDNPTFALNGNLVGAVGLTLPGFVVRVSSTSWVSRTMAVSGSGITIVNTAGAGANPTWSLTYPFRSVAASTTLLTTDDTIYVTTAGITLTLPSPTTTNGRTPLTIIDTTGACETNPIAIVSTGDAFDGVASPYLFRTNYGCFRVRTDSNAWWIG